MSFAQVIPFMFPKTISPCTKPQKQFSSSKHRMTTLINVSLTLTNPPACEWLSGSERRKQRNKNNKKENISCMKIVKARAMSFWHIAHISLSVCCPNYRNGWRSSLRFGERHDKEFIHQEKFHFTNDDFSSSSSSSSTGWKTSTAMNLENSIWILYSDKEA